MRPRLLKGKTIAIIGAGQIGGSILRCLAAYRSSLKLIAYDRNPRLKAKVSRYAEWCNPMALTPGAYGKNPIVIAQERRLKPAVPQVQGVRQESVAQTSVCAGSSTGPPGQGSRKSIPMNPDHVPQGHVQGLFDADIIVLSTPVPEILDLLSVIGKHKFARRPLVLDTGSTKSLVLKTARRYKAVYDFVGLHPLAGTEKSGWEGANPVLFDGRTIVHCPARGSGVAVARELIRLLGARPVGMDARTHDRHVAIAIGLPHLLAYVASGMERGQANPLRAGSWASLTRVASSDPAMVAGLLHSNATELRRTVRAFKRELAALEKALESKSPTALTQVLRCWRRDN